MIYAIGDIHGQKAMLDNALALINTDGGPDAHIVFLGDYTDRGPDSCAVIDTLIEGRDAGRNWTFIKGNHDRFFTRYINDDAQHDPAVASGINWLNPRLGGTNTLASYGLIGTTVFADHTRGDQEVFTGFNTATEHLTPNEYHSAARNAVPLAHIDFLENCQLTYQTDDLLFVHAGIRAGIAVADQDTEDLLWIRDGFLENKSGHGPLVIHGHTALDAPQHFGNRVDLDGGAGYGRPLIPAVFEGRDCFLLTDQGRVPLLTV